METRKKFSAAEQGLLRANLYTEKVTEDQISFTLAFKEAFWRLSVEGCTGNMALRKLGYDPELLGFERVHNITKRIRRLTISELCEIAGVSRSGYYAWLSSEQKRAAREAQDAADFQQILEAYRFRGYAKGVRGIHMRLLHTGVRMNGKKIRRLMKKFGLVCPIRKANPYRRMQKAIRTNNTAENLVKREFEMHGPRSVLLTDITYIPLNGAFCYLSTILDGCTKQVLSYVLSESLEVDFVLETVQKIVHQHGISLKKETILHSDQGCHYTCIKFIQLVKNSSLRQSMSRKGNCWDNAPQESFFGHMKDELAEKIPNWTCFADVQRSIDDWMDYYNNDRYQWALAKLSPNEYYQYLTTGSYPC